MPDAIIERPTGRLIAVELELSPKTLNRLQPSWTATPPSRLTTSSYTWYPTRRWRGTSHVSRRGSTTPTSESFAAAPPMELTMPGKPNPAGDDHIGLLLASTVIGVVIVYATPAPFVIAMGIFTVGRLLGPRLAAVAGLVLGTAGIWLAYRGGETNQEHTPVFRPRTLTPQTW